MKRKLTGFLLILAMLLVAVPASADVSVGEDAGVFSGTALVGKTGTCDNHGGLHDVAGGGIGAPLVNGPKNAKYSIDAPGSVISGEYGTGSLRLCGHLSAPLYDPASDPNTGALGASCGSTKGWGGKGKATWGDPNAPTRTVYISNLGWKITVGGTFLVTADVAGVGPDVDGNKKKQDLLLAEVQALSNGAVLGCLAKLQSAPQLGGTGKGGMQPDPFTVAATYTIVPNAGCENGTTPDCDKKDPKK